MSEVLTNLDAAFSAFSDFAAPPEQRPIAAVADFARLDSTGRRVPGDRR